MLLQSGGQGQPQQYPDIMYSGYNTMKTALCLCDLPSQNL